MSIGWGALAGLQTGEWLWIGIAGAVGVGFLVLASIFFAKTKDAD